jgi:DNA-binding CsgD family transcriptional regulator
MSDRETVARFGTPLSPAELRVIEAMRDADNEEDAARRLGLSRHTVRGHLANARSRLGVRSTRQLLTRVVA